MFSGIILTNILLNVSQIEDRKFSLFGCMKYFNSFKNKVAFSLLLEQFQTKKIPALLTFFWTLQIQMVSILQPAVNFPERNFTLSVLFLLILYSQ